MCGQRAQYPFDPIAAFDVAIMPRRELFVCPVDIIYSDNIPVSIVDKNHHFTSFAITNREKLAILVHKVHLFISGTIEFCRGAIEMIIRLIRPTGGRQPEECNGRSHQNCRDSHLTSPKIKPAAWGSALVAMQSEAFVLAKLDALLKKPSRIWQFCCIITHDMGIWRLPARPGAI